ncbi:hypothetical protein FRC03_003828, partial [Tulasnella sp. 419]
VGGNMKRIKEARGTTPREVKRQKHDKAEVAGPFTVSRVKRRLDSRNWKLLVFLQLCYGRRNRYNAGRKSGD